MGRHSDGEEPLIDIARGDVRLSRSIRRNLEIIEENSSDREFRRLIRNVLDGRTSLREASRMPVFDTGIGSSLSRFDRQWEELSDEDRERLSGGGDQEVEALREEARRKMEDPTS